MTATTTVLLGPIALMIGRLAFSDHLTTAERHTYGAMALILLVVMAICAAIVGGHRR